MTVLKALAAAVIITLVGVLLVGIQQYRVVALQGMVSIETKRNIGKDQLCDPPSHNDIRIAPVVQGSKSGGGLQAVLGIALIAAASFFSGGLAAGAGATALYGTTATAVWTAVGAVGLSLAIGGVAQMVTGTQAGIDSSEAADNRPSYNFAGIKNTVTQGNPVPLCYGEMTVGSAMLSLGIVAEDEQ
jgi:predicted phage tail protein